jgi:hypothetical protein
MTTQRINTPAIGSSQDATTQNVTIFDISTKSATSAETDNNTALSFYTAFNDTVASVSTAKPTTSKHVTNDADFISIGGVRVVILLFALLIYFSKDTILTFEFACMKHL